MPRRRTSRRTQRADKQAKELAKVVVHDVERAGRALTPDEQESYRESKELVVNARRDAAAREGLLRIR
jgi:hypothetical protein